MLQLLDIEFHKLKYSRSSKILAITYFVILSFIALIASIEFNLGGNKILIADLGIFNFPYIWHFNTYVAGMMKFFLAIVIVSMISSEYSNRTLKQNLIDGLSKKEFLLSKVYTVIVFSLFSTLFIFILTLILGYSFSDFTEFSIVTKDMEFLFAYFLKLVAFFSFCIFLAVLVKRSAFALGFLLIWWIIENIIHWPIMRGYFRLSETTSDNIMQFFPLESMSNLINQPITRLDLIKSAASQLQADIAFDYAVHGYEIAIVCVWIFLFIYGSYSLLKKRDL
ncbi:MAG: ABC transporter permease [Cytophagaceae bacterium]|nr:ABC transporter permease [Cytophagaceae bacterium]|tara:strand:+ start:293 stop:1132 length:840 start_codon:yes stop_codon:yes gene_type:complete